MWDICKITNSEKKINKQGGADVKKHPIEKKKKKKARHV